MEILNPLTKSRADTLYVAKAYTRLDGFDNAVDTVILGQTVNCRAITVDYSVVLPVSGRTRTGTIEITYDGISTEISSDAYSFSGSDISGLTFSSDVNSGNIRLVFTKSSVGEHPTLFYRFATVPVA